MRILLVEDEQSLGELVKRKLTKAGYSLDWAMDGEEAEDCLLGAEYDGIILDRMLPKKSGLEVLGALRNRGDKTPVLLLTALNSVENRVEGLDAGADDYLGKPFAMEELLARLRVMLRRASGTASYVFRLGELRLDCEKRQVFRGEKEIALTAREFDILEYLIRNAGIVLSREKIEKHVWNYDYEGGSNVIDVYIRYLRKKIDADYEKKLLHTVRGAGYVLREEE